ncbi:MAG: DUF4097 family beta strand repeat-containing protein [Granulicella sp.]
MSGYPPPYPPPGPPYGPPNPQDLKYQRRILRDQYRYQRRALRRRSIVGPILVVLIGVIFLLIQTGHVGRGSFWMWYGQWWPLLLVAVGVIVLIEWAIDQRRTPNPQLPYARRSLGGGVVFLVVLFALAGPVSRGIQNGHRFFSHGLPFGPDNFDELFGNKHESDESLSQAFPSDAVLNVDNPHGDVIIAGTSSDNQLHIDVHRQVYSRSDADAESKARELTPHISSTGRLVSVTLPPLNGAIADLTITLPSAASVTVTANHGDIRLNSLNAPVTVTANHGDIDLSSIKGAVVAHINNGGSSLSANNITGTLSIEGHGQDLAVSNIDGTLNLSGDFYGATHLERITGAIKYHTSRTDFQLARLDGEMEISPDADLSIDKAVGPVVLTTRNRNITFDRVSGDVSISNRNGSVDLTSAPPLGNVTVQNRNGSVSLTLPDKSAFTVSAETSGGDMENDFNLASQQDSNRKTLNGTVGKGGSLIRINTSQGDVSVRKASIAPLPAAPPRPPAPPAVSIKGEDGSSVYIGKDGVQIIDGADGSSVIAGKDGVHITDKADGGSSYRSPNGTQLIEAANGSKSLLSVDGTRYVEGADGSKSYQGPDGTVIDISASGRRTTTGPAGRSLSDKEVTTILSRMKDTVRRVEQQRDAERKSNRAGKNNDE